MFYEVRLDLGHRYVFLIVIGDADNQQAACNALSARLHLWQTLFNNHSPSQRPLGSMSSPSYADIPRLKSLPPGPPSALNSSAVRAGASGQLAGITLLIHTATSNLFDLTILDRGGEDAATDEQTKFVGFLKELCVQANCLVQLLPFSHIPLSKRHELRRVTIIASSVPVLLDVLTVIHKMIAAIVPYDGMIPENWV